MVCREAGSVTVEETDEPVAAEGQVVVEVEAAGVTYVDALLVAGRYQFPVPTPFVPGGEVAGTVIEVGSGVEGVDVGQRVAAQTAVGGFAERVAVPVRSVVPLPPAVSSPVGATMLQAYMTAVYALTERCSIDEDELVLVLGAGGGVGLAMVDVATSLGARVIAAASTEEKRRAALRAGAVSVIDTSTEDIKVRARELAAELGRGAGSAGSGVPFAARGAGVDVVVDPGGGDLAEPALRSLRFGGRYLVVGFAGGAIPRLPLNLVLLNGRTLVGVELGGAVPRQAGLGARLVRAVVEGVGSGSYHPVAPEVWPLSGAGEALSGLVERRITGKVALDPRL